MDGWRGFRLGWGRGVIAGLLVLSSSACTLVGYPSGRAPDVDLPPPGPFGGESPAAPTPRSEAPDDGGGTPRVSDDDADRRTSRARPLRREPERTDNGRSYTVFGVQYRVLDSAVGYDEVGVASWYGEAFNGRPTASGEIFDMNGLTAAHRSLPLHTWVEVHNLENDERLVLKVNDRGPFVDTGDRIIDLSLGAARRLGVVGPGLARVRIRSVEPPNGE